MIKHTNRLWGVALCVAWFFDFLFWEKSTGISFAIYVLLCLGTGFTLAWGENIRSHRKSLWLLIPISVFVSFTFIRQEPFTRFLNHILTLMLMGMLAHTFLRGRWLDYSLSDYFVSLFKLGLNAVTRPFSVFTKAQIEKITVEENNNFSRSKSPSVWKRIVPVLRGLLLSLPIVAILASLLASADPIFSEYLEDFINIFSFENLLEYIFRATYILILSYLLVGVYLHSFTRGEDKTLIGEEKPWLPPLLGFTEATMVLSSVNLLFVSFVSIQFRYFFGGENNITIEGFTYAEYARRGFVELVVVAFFSLILYLGLSAITRRKDKKRRSVFTGLGIALVLLVAIMLVSAFQRLRLYETAYGFTRLRAYTFVFMIWLAVLLICIISLEFLNKQRTFALAALLTTLGFTLTLNLLNVDGFITTQNVERYVAGKRLDTEYLNTLSNDAIPKLIDIYEGSSLSAEEHYDVGVILACRLVTLQDMLKNSPWQSTHWADRNAVRILGALSNELEGYQVYRGQDGSWQIIVNDEERSCTSSFREMF